MRSRRMLSAAGILALAAMVFAQAAFSLAACELGGRARSHALAMAMQAASAAQCHETAESANLCLPHCQSSDQRLDKPQVKVPPLSLAPVLAVLAQPTREKRFAFVRTAPLPAGPPARILFRSLLI